MTDQQTQDGLPEILFETRGALGVVTLNRPDQLNALSHAMVTAMSDQLRSWAVDPSVAAVVVRSAGGKAFCAGGDVRAVLNADSGGAAEMATFFAAEYRLNHQIKTYPKPYIALVDGICMGGGVGVSVHARYRVAGDGAVIAMPETMIGLTPDVGASYFLPRLPRRLGWHMGLTGARLGPEDALFAHLTDYYVRSDRFSAVLDALAVADYADDADETICEVLSLNAAAPDGAPLKAQASEIEEAYAGEDLAAVLAALEAGSPWAKAQAQAIRERCPTMTIVTFELLRRGAPDLPTALRQEYRACRFAAARPDFLEGVRATLVEKRAPVWSPASLTAVDPAETAGALADLGAAELTL